MSFDLSLVLVTYHSQVVLGPCLASFRRDAAATGLAAEVVVVDHSEEEEEAAAVRGAGADRVLIRPNRGYAAGLNAGAADSRGRVLLLANPDLELLPGCLAGLLAALEAGYTVVGPQQLLDADAPVLFPPPEDPAPATEAWRAMRRRWWWAWHRGLAAEAESCARLWSGAGPVTVASLRGAFLAVERSAWERLGPLDEGYFLHCEETDWLWRARSAGARVGLARSARVVHHWGHAAGRDSRRGELEAASRQRFRRRHWPAGWRVLVGWLERRSAVTGPPSREVAGASGADLDGGELYLLSPFANLMPPLGWVGPCRSPRALETATAAGRWHLASLRRRRGRWRLDGAWHWGAE